MQPGRKFLRSLIEVSHVEFQSYDIIERKVIFTSGESERLLGYTNEEFRRLSIDFYRGIVHPDDMPVMLDCIERLKHSANNEIVDLTIRYRKADGKYIWMYARIMVSERNENEGTCIVTTIVEDVTELIQLQDQLRIKVAELDVVSFKNSHLLRSPVTSIIGLINLIEEKDIVSEHNLQVFSLMKLAIEKLDAVIHEINDVAQSKPPKQEG